MGTERSLSADKSPTLSDSPSLLFQKPLLQETLLLLLQLLRQPPSAASAATSATASEAAFAAASAAASAAISATVSDDPFQYLHQSLLPILLHHQIYLGLQLR